MNRGSIFDIPVIAIVLLGLSFTVIFSYIILSTFAANLSSIPIIPAIAVTQVNTIVGYIQLFDIGLMVIFITLSITTLLLARDLPSHPAYFILTVLGMVIIMFFSWIVQQIYSEFITNSAIVSFASQFPLTSQLMTNLPLVALGLFIMISLAIYTGGESRSVRLPF